MKFKINKDEFLNQISLVQSIVEKRNTMPILSNVLINVYENFIELMATDLEVGLKSTFSAKVELIGSTTVSAKKLFEIVRELPEKDIIFEQSDKDLKITCNRINFKLVCISPDEFPSFPTFSEFEFLSIEEKTLKEMIDKTIYATSMEESRFSLNGIYLETDLLDKKKLRMVATDGHRLAMIDKKIFDEIPFTKNVIIPKKGFQEIRKILSNTDQKVFIGIFENNCVFKKGNITIFIRLMEGEFPDYKEVIPKDNKNIIILNRLEILEALKRISLLSTERFKSVLFDIEENIIKLYSNNPDIGEGEEILEVKYLGNPLSIAFNARYLIDILNVIKSEYIRFELKDAESPCIIRTEDDIDYVCVVMPMRM